MDNHHFQWANPLEKTIFNSKRLVIPRGYAFQLRDPQVLNDRWQHGSTAHPPRSAEVPWSSRTSTVPTNNIPKTCRYCHKGPGQRKDFGVKDHRWNSKKLGETGGKCIPIYIYMYLSLSLYLSIYLFQYVYIYIYIHTCNYVCIL